MGLNQMLLTVGRRWYVMAVFGLLTVAAVMIVPRGDGVYWSRASVVFLAPATVVADNALTPSPEALVNFAAVVEREANNGPVTARFGASLPTSLYGSGVRRGETVEMVNAGGQWTTSFPDPVIVIDVVDSSAESVRATIEDAIARVEQLSASTQAEAGVPPESTIATLPSPEQPVVGYARGNRLRATGGLVALGLLTGLLSTLAVDRVLGARAEARTPVRTGA